MMPQPGLVAEPVRPGLGLPDELDRRKLMRRGALIALLAVVAVAVIVLLPGLSSLRTRFSDARPGWLALGASLKVLSMLAYVVLFRAVFCRRMIWRASGEIAIAELGANAVIPAGGAGGLALGAWALRRGGMPAGDIARRTVAFFLITSAANVVALIVVGVGLAVGLFAGHVSPALSLGPAAVAAAAIVLTLTVGRLAHRIVARMERRGAGGHPRITKLIGVLGDGIDETLSLIAEHNSSVVVGAVGYLVLDIMMVWSMFHAFGHAPPVAIVWIGYLIGQLGGIIPLPGGIGGVDGGLIATYTVYGISAGTAAAAVLSYRALALIIPAILGLIAFGALRRRVQREGDRLALCMPGEQVDVGLGPVGPDEPTSPRPGARKRRGAGRREQTASEPAPSCTHLDSIEVVEPAPQAGCEECLATGGRWEHLRMCQSCGHVGCCDDSPGRHASDHYAHTGHPIIRSVEPGEDWSWCYIDELMFRLRQ